MVEITIKTDNNLDYFYKYKQTKELPLFINGINLGTYKLYESINNFKVLELFLNNKKWYIYSGYGLITSKLGYATLVDFEIKDNSLIVKLDDEEWNEIANSQ